MRDFDNVGAGLAEQRRHRRKLTGTINQIDGELREASLARQLTAQVKNFERMLESLGVEGESSQLVGKDKEILTALDRALKRAPKPRSPFD